jgi:F420-dependent hydroxymycolic acid dehydrogenase
MRQAGNDRGEGQQDHPLTGGLSRRTVLTSTAALIGASTLRGRMPRATAQVLAHESPRAVFSQKGQVGFTLAHEQFAVPTLVTLGQAAEAAGFDLVSTSDHFQPWQPNQGHAGLAWITLGVLGQQTRHLGMGTAVTCPSFRYHPSIVAEAFATLGLLYPGRVFLGLGSGEALNETAATGAWAPWPERSARLIEATGVIRALWTGEEVDHQGQYYQVQGKLYDVPQVPVPIFMAANGPKAMRRAGQYGDGLITDPMVWQEHKAEFDAGVQAAGKDPTQVPVLVEHFVVVGDTTDAAEAAELWRFLPKAWHPYYNIPDPQTIQQRAEAEIPLEEVYQRWPVSTDPDVHVQALLTLFTSGVTHVLVHSGQPDQLRVIRFYGQEVLPRVRQLLQAP